MRMSTADEYHEISNSIYFRNLGKMSQNLSSAAVIIGALKVNPYKPSLLVVGNMQTVPTKTRLASDQGLKCLLTECSIKILIKMKKIPTKNYNEQGKFDEFTSPDEGLFERNM